MFPQLQTHRFLLQQILPEDQVFIFEGLSHPQVIPYYGVQYKTFSEAGLQMQYYGHLWKEQTGAWWKIVDRQTAEKLGAVGYNNYNALHHKCEIGYWLLPQHWHRGIISEALAQLLAYLFKEKKMHRIEALIEEGNNASCRVVEKAGFTCEGLLRDYEQKKDGYMNLHLYSLLATDVTTDMGF
jgi:[ribosomal protein S5]-alanine N-acetyltransferase